MANRCVDLGKMPYAACTELQKRVMAGVIDGYLPNTLLFVEHEPPVFSLGAGFHEENLLLPREEYEKRGFDVEPTERGGDVTFHGPGQLVAYPIFHLDLVGKDLHKWLRQLEEAVIVALREWDLHGYRFPPHTGVWVNGAKVCAIGIKVRKWVSMHGIALNVCNDLSPFDLIVPCGIQGYGVTSIEREISGQRAAGQEAPSGERMAKPDPEGLAEGSQRLSEATPLEGGHPRPWTPKESQNAVPQSAPCPPRPVLLSEARSVVKDAFQTVFGISLEELSREALLARLSEGESTPRA